MISNFLQTVLGWRALTDITLIALGMFFVYHTLRRLGTWKMFLGLVMAMLAYVGANILGLEGITWIFSNLSHVALIGIIIIFQPEIRKMLESSVSPARREPEGPEHEGLPMMIADALFSLAKIPCGAIFVFPGRDPLERFLTGGVPLNADPSPELILSLFDTHSPGHDGALLVRDGRLAGYGFRLPISKSSHLPREMGARHHAGMGLSEITDALVFVVSEERGLVSFFKNGKLSRVPGRKEAVEAITDHWKATASFLPQPEKGAKKWTTAVELVTAFMLTILLWSSVVIGRMEIVEKSVETPIVYVSLPANIALSGAKPTGTRIHMAGPKSQLDSLTADNLRVRIDLSKAQPGKQTFFVSRESLNLPKKVDLLDADPSEINLSLEETVDMEVPVTPQLVGQPRQGWTVVSVAVKPQKVRVVMKKGEGEQQAPAVTTTPIYLDSLGSGATIRCKIIAPPDAQPSDKPWPDVEVQIRLMPVDAKVE
ncbi:diadenylate cyclase [Desulfatibacillum aliphaticivorans]|uniref:diadenylate cyclase n=1 Tax=Desulfatibacillum aliphaticivorans TaxID=218208 RepID=UPI0004235B07|nr:diadenylate cyclase [Desulfatibacillum aliphaticivorans]